MRRTSALLTASEERDFKIWYVEGVTKCSLLLFLEGVTSACVQSKGFPKSPSALLYRRISHDLELGNAQTGRILTLSREINGTRSIHRCAAAYQRFPDPR